MSGQKNGFYIRLVSIKMKVLNQVEDLVKELNCCLFAVSKMYVCVTNGILPSLPKSVRGHDQTLQSRFDYKLKL
jgi:hypothetical protein